MAATIIICIVLVVIVFFAVKSSMKHFSGQGGCCGGGGDIVEEKKLEGKKIGEIVMHIEGMHCDNCKNRVERAINRIDGACAKVDLRKKIAVVSYDRQIDHDALKLQVENLDYKVTDIFER